MEYVIIDVVFILGVVYVVISRQGQDQEQRAKEASLVEIWQRMNLHPTGENGKLRTDGSANRFLVLDADGNEKEVYVLWSDDQWWMSIKAPDPNAWDDRPRCAIRSS